MPSSASATRSAAHNNPGVLGLVIDQNDCHDCGGQLEHGEYKGNPAAVCIECGTPRAQVTHS
jgi:hypothetical protein